MEPFSPSDARKQHSKNTPDTVLNVINQLLAARIYRSPIELSQREVTEKLEASGIREEQFFDRGWIHFENAYEEKGWRVTYSRPNGEGRWLFEAKPGY